MGARQGVTTNGLAVSDENPVEYFLRYADNYFGTLADLCTAEESGVSTVEVAYLRHFAQCWKEMATSQGEKYAHIISKDNRGREMLKTLGLEHLLDASEPVKVASGSRSRRKKKVS